MNQNCKLKPKVIKEECRKTITVVKIKEQSNSRCMMEETLEMEKDSQESKGHRSRVRTLNAAFQ